MVSNLLVRIDLYRKDFSKGQRRIASYIEEHYDAAAFMTAAKLGSVVGVSESTVVRFATELGVSRITPILCQYAVSKPDGSKDSWLQTAIVAMKQSRNPWLPILDEPVAFNTALASATECSFLGAVPSAGASCSTPNPDACRQKGVALWIGPEGGFSPDEENAILGQGACPLTVGPCILRVETAVPALLGALYTLLG